MLNLYYDFDNDTRWTPYLGLGLSTADVGIDSSDLSIDESDFVFAYQGMAGLNLAFS